MNPNGHGNALPTGHRLHWYRIDSVLGQGGFGITYLAHDTNLEKAVAIKEYLPIELAIRQGDSTVHPVTADRSDQFSWGLRRFIDEARTLANFDHPNIVRVHSVFEENATAYMVMTHEVGESLDERAKFGRVGGEAELLEIVVPLLDALEHMHATGYIHRDVKPANIVVRAEGAPVLLDFGSARLALGSERRTLTSVVSAGYAPYEQYQSDGGAQGPWTDIYGFGATLYAAINRGNGPVDAIARGHARIEGAPDPMEPASLLGSGRFSPALLKAIDAALAFRPAERPQDVAAFRALLLADEASVSVGVSQCAESAPSSAGTTASAESLTPTRVPAAPTDPSPEPWWGISRLGALVGMLALIGVVFWFGFGRGVPQDVSTGGAEMHVAQVDAASRAAQEEAARVAAEKEAARVAAERHAAERRASNDAARLAAMRRAAEEEARLAAERRAVEEEARAVKAKTAALQAERERNDRIVSLLAGADADRKALRLTSPEGANAVEKYRVVLALDSDNADAQAGLAAVVDHYLELAATAKEEGLLDKAADYLDRADTILPGAETVAIARDKLVAEREQAARLAERRRMDAEAEH